ncbi:MarR family EPS-associated transcriptional regulator [Saccharophagus sp. K07]|uniref:MarR family EPS-associated transcriptional regulator n=1 Tax=Saccharophagus sp. K07 TaxID=2283636 RepID=UPI001651DA2B|nr:MarR family EPS-associated transcriptional regulator [Saccharophagus sp. K07]MBC6907468.1 MarR family EPS-associated transcriptional regulator [Saccharophagus sp. K07]
MSNNIDETRYQLIRLIERNPDISQRELANQLGISVGKVNYCLKALISVGWIKAGNVVRSNNRMRYAYVLTPAGLREKTKIAAKFLQKKQSLYESLKEEIARLKLELKDDSAE